MNLHVDLQGTERINEEGAVEINVEAVDYRRPPGRDKEPPHKEKVEVTHVIEEDENPGPGNVVAGVAGKVAEKLQSSKAGGKNTD